MKTSELLKISSGELFKFLAIGYGGIFIPIGLIESLLSLFEIVPVSFNNDDYIGIKGFVVSLISIPVYLILMVVATWLFLTIGLSFSKIAFKVFGRN